MGCEMYVFRATVDRVKGCPQVLVVADTIAEAARLAEERIDCLRVREVKRLGYALTRKDGCHGDSICNGA